MTTSREMTTGPALPLILNFTLPLLLGNLLQQTYSLVDAAIVGQFLGIDALAGVGASSSVIFLILGFCNGCCCGFGIPVAQRFGARDYADMRRYVANALRLAVGISVTVAIVTSIWCADILHAMRTPDNIFRDAYLYLLVTFIGIPCTFFYNLLSNIIRALGDSRTPFWFLLFSTVLNIALCFAYMHRHFEILRSTRDERRFRSRHARTLLAIGLPMGLQFSITAIGSIMLQSANNALGSACVAAFTAGVRIKMFVISPFESLGMAMATYTGHNYGAVKPERIWQGIKVAAGLMLGYALFAFVVLMAGSDLLARLFIDPSQSEILADTRLFLHVASYFLPVLGLLCILRYTIQGAGYTNLAMLSGVSEMIARTAVSLWAVPALGYIAVCFGDPTAWIAADLFLVPAFVYVYGRLKRMTPPEKPIGGR